MKSLGDSYETAAVNWLRRHGLRTVQRNFRSRGGEIDIIATDGTCLVFVEVRARSHPRYAGAAESVTARKQRRLIAAAQAFLQRQPHWSRLPCRFDVLAFEPRCRADGTHIRWIRSAFST